MKGAWIGLVVLGCVACPGKKAPSPSSAEDLFAGPPAQISPDVQRIPLDQVLEPVGIPTVPGWISPCEGLQVPVMEGLVGGAMACGPHTVILVAIPGPSPMTDVEARENAMAPFLAKGGGVEVQTVPLEVEGGQLGVDVGRTDEGVFMVSAATYQQERLVSVLCLGDEVVATREPFCMRLMGDLLAAPTPPRVVAPDRFVEMTLDPSVPEILSSSEPAQPLGEPMIFDQGGVHLEVVASHLGQAADAEALLARVDLSGMVQCLDERSSMVPRWDVRRTMSLALEPDGGAGSQLGGDESWGMGTCVSDRGDGLEQPGLVSAPVRLDLHFTARRTSL